MTGLDCFNHFHQGVPVVFKSNIGKNVGQLSTIFYLSKMFKKPLIFAKVLYVFLLVLSDTPISDNPLMIHYIIVKVKVLIKKNNSSKVQILKKLLK